MNFLYRKSKSKYFICLFVLVTFLLQITLATGMPLVYANEEMGNIGGELGFSTEAGEADTSEGDVVSESDDTSETDNTSEDDAASEDGDAKDTEDSSTEDSNTEDPNGNDIEGKEEDTPAGDGSEDETAKTEQEPVVEDPATEEPPELKDEEPLAEELPEIVDEKAAPNLAGMIMSLFGEGGGRDLGNIFTFVGLWVGSNEIEENTPVELTADTTVTMRYNWSIKGLNPPAQPGDTASIEIPDIFDTAGSFPDSPILLSDNETKVGTWTISSGYLKFTFDEGLEGIDPDALEDAFVEFGFKLNMNQFEEGITQRIEFSDSLNKEFKLTVKPDTTAAKAITKVGIPDGTGTDAKKDAKNITWTIDVLNTGNTSLEGAVLSEDTIPTGLSLKTDSFYITPLIMGLNGTANLSLNGSSTHITNPSKGEGFEVNLPKMEPYNGYRVTYTTAIDGIGIESFTNTAKLTKGEDEPITAIETVTALTYTPPIVKSGKKVGNNNDEIEWTITVNEGKSASIATPIVKDTLPDGLAIKEVAGTKQIKVFKNDVDVTGSAGVADSPFAITLPSIGNGDTYKIVYTTTIDYTKVNEGVYRQTSSFTNQATLSNGASQIGDPVSYKVDVTRKNLLAKEGSNPSNYGDTLSWTIKVNEAYHSIANATLHDKIPADLLFNKDNVTIKKRAKNGSWVTLTDDAKPTVSDMDGDRKVTITLGNITEEYEINYTTKLTAADFAEGKNFKNEAWLTYDNPGTGPGSGTLEHKVGKELKPADNSYNKISTGVDYAEKTISWKMEIDPIKEPITELHIVDTFPHNGLIFLPDSLEIKKGSTTIMTPITDYTLAPNTVGENTGYQNGFTVAFTPGTSENPLLSGQKITITYQTSYDPQEVVDENVLIPYTGTGDTKEYKNQAAITGQTKSAKSINKLLNATALTNENTDSPSWNSGKKEGSRVYKDNSGAINAGWVSGKERLIEWKIYINYLAQDLGNGVTVTDTLGYDGTIVLDSVKIKEYTVNSSSGATIDGDTAPILYDKTLSDDDKTLNISFSGTVDKKRYVIIYHTTVPDKSQGTYSNHATVKVAGTDYPYQGSVSYNEHQSFVDKKALVTGTKVYTDDEVNWEIAINDSLSTNMANVVVTDTIAKGMAFKSGSLEIYRIEGGSEVDASGEYESDVTGNHNDGTTLTITFKGPISHKYIIRYQTIVTAISGTVSNTAKITGSHVTGGKTSGKTFSSEKFGSTGGVIANKGKIRIEKADPDGSIITANPIKAQFKLWYNLNGEQVPFNQGELFTTNNGVIEITNLPLREYQLEEVTAPKGFEKLAEKVTVNVNKQFQNKAENVIKVEVKNQKTKISITGTKKWIDSPDDKPAITLQLYRNEDVINEVELTGEPWSHTWNVDKTDNQGKDYNYRVDEKEDLEHYTKDVALVEGGFEITNTYTYVSDKIEITGTKVWKGGPEVKPDIQLQLYRNNEALEDPVTLTNGTTTHTWINLDKTDHGRTPYQYRIDEVKVPANHSKSISEDGLTITNTYYSPPVGGGSPKTAITGGKIWEGGPSSKPTIQLQLYRNGIEHGDPVELTDGQLSYTWNDVDKNDNTGKDYTYTVDELAVPANYVKAISKDGLIITNTYNGKEKEYAIDLKANPSTIVGDGKSETVLTAKVTDENGNPVAGVEVFFDAPMGTFLGDPGNPESGKNTGLTNANGEAHILYRSEKIEGIESKVVPVNATVEDPEKDLYATDTIYVTFEPASIIGVVIDNTTGKPIDGAKVIVTKDFDGDGIVDFYAEQITGPDGKYKIAIPKGDMVYDVEIIKPIYLNGEKVEVSFKQKAQAGEVSADKEDEEFPAKETFTGIIITKDKEGNDKIACKETGDKITIRQVNGNGSTGINAVVDPNTGVFTIEGLSKGQTYEFVMTIEAEGQELVAGKIVVQLDTDGEISIHQELIDPYGTITDGKTGEVLGDVHVELFYADTARNRAKGRTPHTKVVLPALPGFAPNDNENPQWSTPTTVFNNHPSVKDHGNYAWMVFPEADYYIKGTKTGYTPYTSPTIYVDFDVVKHDFAMQPLDSNGNEGSSGGGGSSGGSSGGGGGITLAPTKPDQPPVTPELAAPEVPEKPTEPQKPQEPVNPETPADPSAQQEAKTLETGNHQGTAETPMVGKAALPKTGENTNLGFYLLGMLFIALGLYLGKRRTS
ncbi:collagen binding domain-containing protein [Desulfotomaculum sp. 1211_IL3151]|uniref:collagen binding domain-containing protein n=1 Tax=Desulfotomaculum sp. 1211_IL3151 TaxID=3084055 RepID=UPI002FDB326B